MSRLQVLFIVLFAGPCLFAKANTSKITIHGADLKTPIQIIDQNVLADFHVWSGLGTGSSTPGYNPKAPSFIVDWSRGPCAEPPKDLPRYEVSFYGDLPNERVIYVVAYAFDRATGHGYVYLPSQKDKNYSVNVRSILRGVEGNWFPSWSKWDEVAKRLLESRSH